MDAYKGRKKLAAAAVLLLAPFVINYDEDPSFLKRGKKRICFLSVYLLLLPLKPWLATDYEPKIDPTSMSGRRRSFSGLPKVRSYGKKRLRVIWRR